MKSEDQIKQRIKQLEKAEKEAAKEIKNCDYDFLDINITRANIIQQERQVLEWVLK